MTYRSYHDATTRSSVLRAVSDTTNEAAWARFFDLYAGFVFAVARSKGLSAEDADDVVQNVFIDLARKMPTFSYDRQKGRFRSYLLELISWRVKDKLKVEWRETKVRVPLVEMNEEENPAANAYMDKVEREWQAAVLNEALRRLQQQVNPDHFAAFVEKTVEGHETETVLQLHGLTRDNFYQICTRLREKLKPLLATVRKEMDEGQPPSAGGVGPRNE